MATKAQTAAAVAAAELEALHQQVQLLSDDTFDNETLNPALETLFAEMGVTDGGDATVHVSKLDSDGRGVEAQIWKGDPDLYDLEMLAKKFGSGSYRVRVYVKIPTGQRVLKANKVFAWLLSPEDEAKRNGQPNQMASQPQQDIGKIVADAVAAALAQVNANRAPPVDPMQQLASLASIMATLQPQQQNAAPPPDPFNMMRGVIEMMQMMKSDEPIAAGGNAGTSDVLLGLVNKFGPLLANTLMQQQGAPAQLGGVPAVAYQPNPIAAQPAQPVQGNQPSAEEEMSIRLKMGIAWLVGQCDGGGAPETYAEVVIDSVPADALQMILSRPDPVSFFVDYEPRAGQEPYKQWFADLLTAVREMLTPEPDEENQLDKPAGTP